MIATAPEEPDNANAKRPVPGWDEASLRAFDNEIKEDAAQCAKRVRESIAALNRVWDVPENESCRNSNEKRHENHNVAEELRAACESVDMLCRHGAPLDVRQKIAVMVARATVAVCARIESGNGSNVNMATKVREYFRAKA